MANKIQDDDLLLLVLAGKSQTDIAKILHCTKATVNRRIHSKEFSKVLSDCRKRRIETALTSLTDGAQKAADTLKVLMDSENDFVRLHASSKVLQQAQDFSLQNDLLMEIDDIRRAMEESGE